VSDTRTKIAVIDDWQSVARSSAVWSQLQSRAQVDFFSTAFASERDTVQALAPYQVIVPMRERLPLTRSLLTQLPQLRMLALTGYGTRHVDMGYCAERGIVCCGSGGAYSPVATAELTLGLILAAQRQIAVGDASIRAGEFQSGIALGRVLEGSILGVIGLGRIGTRVAAYAQALGMQTLAWSTHLDAGRAAAAGVQAVSKQELLARADIVSLHLVLSERSSATLGAAELANMKPGALLVNTARAGLVDQAALLAALQSGQLRAALDVYAHEPLPADDPLRRAPNTLLTPHLGFSTASIFTVFYGQSVENIVAFLDGQPIRVVTQ